MLFRHYIFGNKYAVVAEWLRRLTRNQITSGSIDSNPTTMMWNHYYDDDYHVIGIYNTVGLQIQCNVT